MRYVPDHDLHNHTALSPCSNDPRQTKEAILAYALTNGFRLVCVTDHAWDSKVECPCFNSWESVDFERARRVLPLPQSSQCRFLMGCEVDMNQFGTVGISREEWDRMDFVLLSTSHLNLVDFTIDPRKTGDDALSRKEYYKQRLHRLLEREDIPFYKTGLPHFTVSLVCQKDPVGYLELFGDGELKDIFTKVRRRGMGVELNFEPDRYTRGELKRILRPYGIAKECGCKFFFGGDAHVPENFVGRREAFEKIINLLQLEEKDKFPFVAQKIARSDLE